MSEKCPECGAMTVWEQELGSAICPECGTLVNPSQNILASHLEQQDTSGYEYTNIWGGQSGAAGSSTLKGRNGWAFAGQDKEARDRRNMIAMHEFIRSVVARLSNPGLAPRAQTVFDQAMVKGRYRWGRKAKLIAGASIAIALRESHKSDSLKDIAYLLDEPAVALSRTFTATVDLLQLKLASADPTLHLPTLQTRFLSLVTSPATPILPAPLLTALSPLAAPQRLASVINTATSLSALIARVDTLANLPTPPTACALFLLALEAEHGSSLPSAGVLAGALGARVGASKKVVMQRYKVVYDIVEEWIREVPWLEAHKRVGKKGKGKGKEQGEGRSKVAKRVVVARGLKDVVQFQEEIWRKKMEEAMRPQVELELEADEGAGGEDVSDGGTSELSVVGAPPREDVARVRPPQMNKAAKTKMKTVHERSLAHASQFLLDPLASSASTGSRRRAGNTGSEETSDLCTHLLTADTSALWHAYARAPSRLQMLATERGEDAIADEELFEEGELEGLMRTEAEIGPLRIAMDWSEVDEGEASAQTAGTKQGKRKRDDEDVHGGPTERKRTRRIDMNALAKLLDPGSTLDGSDEEYGYMGKSAEEVFEDGGKDGEYTMAGLAPLAYGAEDAEEVLEEWRPPSPGGTGFDEDRYL